jgi:hypothetical protein
MKVGVIRTITQSVSDDEHIACVWLDRDDANSYCEQEEKEPLNNNEWEEVALKFSRNESIDQYATDCFRDYIQDVLNERDKK